ncbi:MAG: hypothetical protein P8H33_01140 [Crocinitomicaceae bacterium]|nr:hypothetical protein [Crocinitomicaceae bacterium]
MMKLTVVFLFVMCFCNASFSAQFSLDELSLQDTSVTYIQKEILLDGSISYTFQSNRVLLAERADVWESRFGITFPDIISIELNVIDQSIYLVLSASHTVESLNTILKRFKVVNYLIQT